MGLVLVAGPARFGPGGLGSLAFVIPQSIRNPSLPSRNSPCKFPPVFRIGSYWPLSGTREPKRSYRPRSTAGNLGNTTGNCTGNGT